MAHAESSSLEILNPTFDSKATDTFENFNRLPPELRWSIWKLGLNHERLLYVEALPLKQSTDEGDAENSEDPRRAYEVILTEYQPISKLARVNSESRAATSSFYRVQMPCVYRWEGKGEAKGTFYFNPELDSLEIRGRYWASLAQDLWVHDPRRVGLTNFAVADERFVKMRSNSIIDYPCLKKVIPRLKRVIFVYHGGIERMFLGEPRATCHLDKAMIYRSRPIMPATARFDRLPCDPRSSIEASLKQVYLGWADPRRLVHGWLRLVAKCDVENSHEIDYRFMIAFGGRNHPNYGYRKNAFVDQGWTGWMREPGGWALNPVITNRCDALRLVSKKDARWREILRETRETEKKDPTKVFEEVELPLQPAVGFWLFPIEALGPLPDLSKSHRNLWGQPRVWKYHRKIDLSGFKPELCLSYLP